MREPARRDRVTQIEVDEAPQFVEEAGEQAPAPRPVRATPASTPRVEARPAERKLTFIGTLDKPLIVVVGLLLAVGMMMVYSTTFYWSYQDYGSASTVFLQHLRNVGISLIGLLVAATIDYRIWKRIAVPLILITIGALIAVLLFGDETFGAKRSLIGGRFQPGELAEFATIVYMAAWLGSKSTKIRSLTYGLIPFAVLVGILGALVLGQPDFSTAGIIFVTAGTMFFLAGAQISQLVFVGVTTGGIGWLIAQRFGYAEGRWQTYVASFTDITRANYQTLQAWIAFQNGGWTGMGLGQGWQKFQALPAPHTDSIFAVIGEELGILGAALVVLLFIVFVVRGFQIARRAGDPFGALLAAGVTVWVVFQALLNIAVMLALVPSTGVPLPFISFGGSSLLVVMIGVGLLLSVQRVTIRRQHTPDRRNESATVDRQRRDRGSRVSSTRRSRGDGQVSPR